MILVFITAIVIVAVLIFGYTLWTRLLIQQQATMYMMQHCLHSFDHMCDQIQLYHDHAHATYDNPAARAVAINTTNCLRQIAQCHYHILIQQYQKYSLKCPNHLPPIQDHQ